MVRKIRIVFVITFTPRYKEYETKPKPEHNWLTASGSWVGVWGYDFGDLIGKAVTQHYQDVEYEVWQPDYRADRIYAAQIGDRLVHRLFPAKRRIYRYGARPRGCVYSKPMVKHAAACTSDDIALLIPATVITPFVDQLIAALPRARIIHYNFLNSSKMLPRYENTVNPVNLLHRWLISRQKNLRLIQISNLLTTNDNPGALEELQVAFPSIKVLKFVMSFDLSYWKRDKNREQARACLDIPTDMFIIVLSQRLIPDYQIDRFIEALSRVSTKQAYCCYVTGHGLPEYEQYLKDLTKRYGLENKLRFVGYVRDEELRTYLMAADLFATLATLSAGSGGAVKAMALEVPVLHSQTGSTYEFLRTHDCGAFVDPTDHKQWTATLEGLIKGRPVGVVPRDIVANHYSWVQTAEAVYDGISAIFKY
jgi:glycosyltransferase involved in cell wall biosynthesis